MQIANVNQARFVDTYANVIPATGPSSGSPAQDAFSAYQATGPSEIGKERTKRDTLFQKIELKDVAESGTLRDSVRNRLTDLGNEIKKDPNNFTKIEVDGCYKRINEGAKRSAAAAEHYLETFLKGAGIEKDISTGERRCGRGKDDFRNKHNVEVRVYTKDIAA